MPPTLEVACRNPDCPLDMFELAFTYELVSEADVENFVCPYCQETDTLERLFYTYEDSR